jgi:tight adherence protein C
VLRRAPLRSRLEKITQQSSPPGPGSHAETSHGTGQVTKLVGNIGAVVSSGRSSSTLRQHLVQAGYHDANAAGVYIGVKILLLLVGLLGAAALVAPTHLKSKSKEVLVGVVGLSLFMAPNVAIAAHRGKRQTEIRHHLPDTIDLLEICTSAGMGLDMAWNAVTDEVRHVSVTLADEMALTNLEIHLGASRAQAMRHMASRTGADELSSLVAILVQSERFGTRVSDALQDFASYMRETRTQRAQEMAEKMAVKLIFPMVMFIFPAVVMVMTGPAFMSLFHAMRAR